MSGKGCDYVWQGMGCLGVPGTKKQACLLPHGTIPLGLRVLGYVCSLPIARSDRPDECGIGNALDFVEHGPLMGVSFRWEGTSDGKQQIQYHFSGNSADGRMSDCDIGGACQQGEDLREAAQNPITDLISVPFQNNTNFDIGRSENTQNVLNIRPVYPVHLNQSWNLITRPILPVISQPPFFSERVEKIFDRRPNGTGVARFPQS